MTLRDYTVIGLMLLLGWSPAELTAAQLIATTYLDNDRVITNYVLDNPFLKVIVSPDKGGGIEKIAFKMTGITLTDGLSFTDQLYHHFSDNDRTIEEYESLEKSRFTVVKIDDKQNDKRVSLSVSSPGQSSVFKKLIVTKTYKLLEKECALFIEYQLSNASSNSINAGFWVHTHLRTGGKNQAERNIIFTPTSSGISAITHPATNLIAEKYWIMDPPLDWKAFIGLESKAGAVVLMDYRCLSCFYDRYERNCYRSSCDWAFCQQIILPQQAWTTRMTLIPFTGLDHVDGVMNECFVYSLDCAPAGTNLSMAKVELGMAYRGPQRLSLNCKLWLRSPDNAPLCYPPPAHDPSATNTQALILQSTANFNAGATVHFSKSYRPPMPKPYDYTLELYGGTNLHGSITLPIIIGPVATNIVIKPLDPIKDGEPCLKPFKILSKDQNIIYRRIPDTNGDVSESP